MNPKARQDDLLMEEVADELVVYDQQRKLAHSLNRTAALVWRHCDGQRSITDLAKLLRAELDPVADEDLVLVAIDRLEASHLLEEPFGARQTRRGHHGARSCASWGASVSSRSSSPWSRPWLLRRRPRRVGVVVLVVVLAVAAANESTTARGRDTGNRLLRLEITTFDEKELLVRGVGPTVPSLAGAVAWEPRRDRLRHVAGDCSAGFPMCGAAIATTRGRFALSIPGVR